MKNEATFSDAVSERREEADLVFGSSTIRLFADAQKRRLKDYSKRTQRER